VYLPCAQSCVRSFEDEEEDADDVDRGRAATSASAGDATSTSAAEGGAAAVTSGFKRPKIIKNPNAGAIPFDLTLLNPSPIIHRYIVSSR
jgi:hypothetical protein